MPAHSAAANLVPSTDSEVPDRAGHIIPLTVRTYGINPEIIGRPPLEIIEPYAEDCRRVALVQPDRRSGYFDHAAWTETIVHDSVMHRGAAGVVRGPSDNR